METGVMEATLEAIEQAAEQGNDIWEMVISAGITSSDDEDKARWQIGDLALLVKKEYGEDAIGKFAKEIKCPVKTVKNRRQICAFWDRRNSPRRDFLAELPNVYFSHYREAVRLGDLEQAIEFIEECHLNDWTVEAAALEINKRLGKPVPPAKLVDSELPIYRLDKCRVTFELAPDAAARLFDTVDNKRVVRLMIYEVKGLVTPSEDNPNKPLLENWQTEEMETAAP